MLNVTVLGEYRSPVSHLCKLRHPIVRLSTGRVVLIGKHSYCSRVREDCSEITMSEYVELTRSEEDECWSLVNRYDEVVEQLELLGGRS